MLLCIERRFSPVLLASLTVVIACRLLMHHQPMNDTLKNLHLRSFAYDLSTNMNYEVHGEGPPSLIFLHGFGASRESWLDILPFLQGIGTMYLVDLKGHGLSSKPNDAQYSLRDQADIISAFIEREHIEDVVLVGHSYGGAVALMTYFELRAKGFGVSSLVLIDSPGYLQTFPFFVSILRKPIINRLVLTFIPAEVRARQTLDHIFYDRKNVSIERIHRYAQYFDLPGAHHAFIECAKHIVPSDIDAFVAQIPTVSIPTLIVWGNEDPIISIAVGERLHGEIHSSQFVVLPQCGHVAQEEQPRSTGDVIAQFVASVR